MKKLILNSIKSIALSVGFLVVTSNVSALSEQGLMRAMKKGRLGDYIVLEHGGRADVKKLITHIADHFRSITEISCTYIHLLNKPRHTIITSIRCGDAKEPEDIAARWLRAALNAGRGEIYAKGAGYCLWIPELKLHDVFKRNLLIDAEIKTHFQGAGAKPEDWNPVAKREMLNKRVICVLNFNSECTALVGANGGTCFVEGED
ncbi:MAG: hypothetical protein LBL99_00085 [Holosporaceae bacterium]|nr:hypothetical protein [Holosporaceae bacterium]